MKSLTTILSINGSDSTGRSGIQADIKVMKDMGCEAMTAVTSVTVQSSQGIAHISSLPSEVVCGQVRAVYSDCRPRAVKVGMISGAGTIRQVRDEIMGCRCIVCSPVVVASDGARLMDDESIKAYRRWLLPICKLMIVKSQDAELVLGVKIRTDADMEEAARMIHEDGAEYVLLRGSGHAPGRVTTLLYANGEVHYFSSYNVDGWQRHGIAGSLSMALTVRLAMGDEIGAALKAAHEYVHSQIVYRSDNEGYGIRAQEIYNKFLSLLVEHHREHHDVGFYADRLAITPRYLAQTTRAVADKTPKELIDSHLLLQSKNLLLNTSLDIQEISDKLGFSSPVLFTRFIKLLEGVPPRHLRGNFLTRR